MKTNSETSGLLSSYLGLDGRTLGTFATLVIGVVVVVTGIYVAIFGFEKWKKDMTQAGSMMVAGFNATTPAPSGVPSKPAELAPTTPSQARPRTAPSPNGSGAAQYVCPSCGATGLPNWTASGTPLCPNCGGVMGVAGRSGTHLHLAARP